MSLLVALIAMAAVATDGPVSFVARAETSGEIVRLADVADLSALPPALRARAAGAQVARLSRSEQTLSSHEVARRARAAMPALAAWLPVGPDEPILVRRLESPTSPSATPQALPPVPPVVRAGDLLTVRVAIGQVTVEREVHALQSGRAGQAVFVRTPEGAVLRAHLADDQ